MKKLVILFVATIFSVSIASAQDYNWAIGARLGGQTSGLSFKYNLNAANSIEGVLAIPYDGGFNLLGLYERNVPVIAPGFNFYYGGGAHLGAWDRRGSNDFVFGIDGVVGLEYKIKSIPLAFSLDYKPALNIIGHSGFYWGDFGFGIKIAF